MESNRDEHDTCDDQTYEEILQRFYSQRQRMQESPQKGDVIKCANSCIILVEEFCEVMQCDETDSQSIPRDKERVMSTKAYDEDCNYIKETYVDRTIGAPEGYIVKTKHIIEKFGREDQNINSVRNGRNNDPGNVSRNNIGSNRNNAPESASRNNVRNKRNNGSGAGNTINVESARNYGPRAGNRKNVGSDRNYSPGAGNRNNVGSDKNDDSINESRNNMRSKSNDSPANRDGTSKVAAQNERANNDPRLSGRSSYSGNTKNQEQQGNNNKTPNQLSSSTRNRPSDGAVSSTLNRDSRSSQFEDSQPYARTNNALQSCQGMPSCLIASEPQNSCCCQGMPSCLIAPEPQNSCCCLMNQYQNCYNFSGAPNPCCQVFPEPLCQCTCGQICCTSAPALQNMDSTLERNEPSEEQHKQSSASAIEKTSSRNGNDSSRNRNESSRNKNDSSRNRNESSRNKNDSSRNKNDSSRNKNDSSQRNTEGKSQPSAIESSRTGKKSRESLRTNGERNGFETTNGKPSKHQRLNGKRHRNGNRYYDNDDNSPSDYDYEEDGDDNDDDHETPAVGKNFRTGVKDKERSNLKPMRTIMVPIVYVPQQQGCSEYASCSRCLSGCRCNEHCNQVPPLAIRYCMVRDEEGGKDGNQTLKKKSKDGTENHRYTSGEEKSFPTLTLKAIQTSCSSQHCLNNITALSSTEIHRTCLQKNRSTSQKKDKQSQSSDLSENESSITTIMEFGEQSGKFLARKSSSNAKFCRGFRRYELLTENISEDSNFPSFQPQKSCSAETFLSLLDSQCECTKKETLAGVHNSEALLGIKNFKQSQKQSRLINTHCKIPFHIKLEKGKEEIEKQEAETKSHDFANLTIKHEENEVIDKTDDFNCMHQRISRSKMAIKNVSSLREPSKETCYLSLDESSEDSSSASNSPYTPSIESENSVETESCSLFRFLIPTSICNVSNQP